MENARYPLRGLVACAGISDGGPSVDFPLDRVKRLLDVNVAGTFACAQAVGKIMSKMPDVSGSVVLIASMSGHGSNLVGAPQVRVVWHDIDLFAGCRYGSI